jgi:hypothetical protein
MKPRDFSELIQGVLSLMVATTFLGIAIVQQTFSDALIAGFSATLGFWIGSATRGTTRRTDPQ